MKKLMALLTVLIVIVTSTVACAGNQTSSAGPYLPTKPGTILKYQIGIGKTDPLFHQQVSWPITGGHTGYEVRGYINSDLGNAGKTFELDLRIKGSVSNEGCVSHANGIELEILTDTFGIYKGVKQLFWFLDGDTIEQVLTFSPDSYPGLDQQSTVQGDGCSLRPLMTFAQKTWMGSATSDPNDYIGFNGFKTLTNFEGQLAHDQRVVKVDLTDIDMGGPWGTPGYNYIDSGFTEDCWFAPNLGLVQLVQTVQVDKTEMISMTWTLEH